MSLLPETWKGFDPTSIAESTLNTLLDMLEAEFVGLRFNDTTHVFLRSTPAFGETCSSDAIRTGLKTWSAAGLSTRLLNLADEPMVVVQCPLGENASIGVVFAGARRAAFPDPMELAKLKLGASQAALACREMREVSDRRPPADPRDTPMTEGALAASEWRLHLTINSIPAMAWSTTPDGLIDFCNQNFVDYVGWPAEEICGQGFWPIFHPEDTAHLLAAWQEIMATKRPREVEGRIRRADGQYRWFVLRQNPLFDADGGVIKWYGAGTDIEDRKRAETALEEARAALLASEQNLNLIINSLPVLVWSARPDGSADFINQSWRDYVGEPADKILEWGFLDLYHPDDVQGMLEIWTRDIAHKDQTKLKGRIRGADGQYRWFYFAGRKLTDANGVVRWFGCNVDIENLQRAEDALRENERRLQHIINAVPGLVWSADASGAVTFLSQQYLDYIGQSRDRALGGSWAEAIHPDDAAGLLVAWTGALAERRAHEHEARLRRADGSYRWMLFRASASYDELGQVTDWFGVNIDVDDRNRAEENLRQSQNDLAHVTRMTTMGELAVSIAHEVNQPLMAVVTNAGACLRWLDGPQPDILMARQAAERIIRDGHRAGDIITSLRNLARKSAPRLDRVRLDQVIPVVLDLLQGEFRRHGVTANAQLGDATIVILGDTIQLQQVVLNLVVNAVEAMAGAAASSRFLTVSAVIDTSDALVSVTDTGTGVGTTDPERLFEPFHSTKAEGLGMGLPICRSIIEAHGGRIWATTNDAGDSVFSFTLPLAEG